MKDMEEKVLSIIEEHEKNGDVYQTCAGIIARVQGQFPEITSDEISLILANLSQSGNLVHIGNEYAITDTRYDEDRLARMIAKVIRCNTPSRLIDAEHAVSTVESQLGFFLSQSQQDAIVGALSSRMAIITSGPGTGKTTVLRALCDAFEASQGKDTSIYLMAPTGKAARRLFEQTGRPASTVHSILYAQRHNEESIQADLIVVDEASMLSIPLLAELLGNTKSDTQVVLVGDPDQLPAVGPGQVLKDLIASGLPVYVLTDNFRQGPESILADNVYQIRNRYTSLTYDQDHFALIESESSHDTEQLALSLYLSLRAQYGNQVQILTPVGSAGGVCSAARLNKLVQSHLNPHTPQKLEVMVDGTVYRIGDRVIQCQNNGVARNGDIGTIVGIVGDSSITVQIRFDFGDDETVCYPISELEHGFLNLAYALTIHKAQGSEYDYVIIPLCKEHIFSWSNNMVYTAISRAKKRVILVGSRCVLDRGIRQPLPPCRSKLADKIHQYLTAKEKAV